MRALWSLVVACLVAVGGAGRVDARGAERDDARTDLLAAALARPTPPLAHAASARPALQAITARGTRAKDAGHPTPDLALAASLSLAPPALRVLEQSYPVRDRSVARLIRTGSARGPPTG